MEAPTAKRGVFPLHGFKLGLYRLPLKLDEDLEIQSVHDGLKNTFEWFKLNKKILISVFPISPINVCIRFI